MAQLTRIDLEAARQVARAYGLDLTRLTPLHAGSVNSNFLLETSAGRFFMRIFEEQGVAGAEQELRLLQGLSRCGVPTTPPPARLDGALVSSFGDKPVALYPWIEGDIVCTELATAERCEAVAKSLAHVHLAGADLPEAPASRFDVAKLKERLSFIREHAAPDLVAAAGKIEERLEFWLSKRADALPEGLIHGDLFRDNVLWRGAEVAALIDFESASKGRFAFDLMVLILAWCFRDTFDLDRVSAMLRGYQSVRPLTAAERAGLVAEGAIAALRFATTRITDFSMRIQPAQPGAAAVELSAAPAAPLRDYRRFLQRLAELEAGDVRRVLAA